MKSRYCEIFKQGLHISNNSYYQKDINHIKTIFHIRDNGIRIPSSNINEVYEFDFEGSKTILKIALGSLRSAELKRENDIINLISESSSAHLVPKTLHFGTLKNSAYLTEEFINGLSLKELLNSGVSNEKRKEIWIKAGTALSQIHNIFKENDNNNSWLNEQILTAEINLKSGILDDDEFLENTPEELLSFLKANKPAYDKKTLIHGDYRTKNLIFNKNMDLKIIDWGFVDIGNPLYDLAIIDYYFQTEEDRKSFYTGYGFQTPGSFEIKYFDILSKFINV